MRLLKIKADGSFSLVEMFNNIPPYAILSHTWGKAHEEVTFQDLVNDTGKDKNGYRKIRFCGEQANKDGYEYFWVDSCCIDKSSSAELSEAINSMWRWYKNGGVCYAYLSDVLTIDGDAPSSAKFAESKWFTRGWTLQELLAPNKCLFYTAKWEFIGSKLDLAESISSITRIGKYFLEQSSSRIHHASIAERMCWASNRTTTREEDIAYCLLGLFDVNMPLLYGEGARAFQRLQEQIMKQSDDQSIFAWFPSQPQDSYGILAMNPSDFRHSEHVVSSIDPRLVEPFTITNRGLQVKVPLMITRRGDFVRLNCRFRNNYLNDLGLPIRLQSNGQYARRKGDIITFSASQWNRAPVVQMYMKLSRAIETPKSGLREGSILFRELPPDYQIASVGASGSWDGGQAIEPTSPTNYSEAPEAVELMIASSLSRHLLMVRISYQRRFGHKNWIPVAQFLPTTPDAIDGKSKVISHWQSKVCYASSRGWVPGYGNMYTRAVSIVIRGKRHTIIDFIAFPDTATYWLSYRSSDEVDLLREAFSIQCRDFWTWASQYRHRHGPLLAAMLTTLELMGGQWLLGLCPSEWVAFPLLILLGDVFSIYCNPAVHHFKTRME